MRLRHTHEDLPPRPLVDGDLRASLKDTNTFSCRAIRSDAADPDQRSVWFQIRGSHTSTLYFTALYLLASVDFNFNTYFKIVSAALIYSKSFIPLYILRGFTEGFHSHWFIHFILKNMTKCFFFCLLTVFYEVIKRAISSVKIFKSQIK